MDTPRLLTLSLSAALLLGCSDAATPNEHVRAVEATVTSYETVHFGSLPVQISDPVHTDEHGRFHHYIPESVKAQRRLGYIVMRHAEPLKRNHAGFVSIVSGGFKSGDLAGLRQNPRQLFNRHLPYIEAGYTVFLVNHGDPQRRQRSGSHGGRRRAPRFTPATSPAKSSSRRRARCGTSKRSPPSTMSIPTSSRRAVPARAVPLRCRCCMRA